MMLFYDYMRNKLGIGWYGAYALRSHNTPMLMLYDVYCVALRQRLNGLAPCEHEMNEMYEQTIYYLFTVHR